MNNVAISPDWPWLEFPPRLREPGKERYILQISILAGSVIPPHFPPYSAGWVQGSVLQSRLKMSDSLLWTRMTQHYDFSYRTLMQLDTHLVATPIFRTSPSILMKSYCHLPLGIPLALPHLHFQALICRKH